MAFGHTLNPIIVTTTGLELSGNDTDGFSMLPATVVQRLEPPAYVLAEAPDTPAFYLCLGADNRCGATHETSTLERQL